jgi:hypothetical protein
MHGLEVTRIRKSLGEVVGRPLSERELGMMLGLPEPEAETTVRKWEEGDGPSGSAAVALWLLAFSTDDDHPPPHVLAEGADYTPPGAKPDVAFKAMMSAVVRELLAQTRE